MDTPVDALLAALADQRAGRAPEAERSYHAILAAQPGQPDASLHLGLLLLRAARGPEAVRHLRVAAAARPDARVRLRLAEALLASGDPAQALQAADAAASLDPEIAEAWFLRGTALNALGRWPEAEQALRAAIRRAPDHAEAHLNLGNALADLDRLDEALVFLRRAASLAPDLVEAHASLGFALTAAHDFSGAIAACERAVALRPASARAHSNLGVAAMLSGDWPRGWRESDTPGARVPVRPGVPDPPGPRWGGEALAGRTLLVRADQGLGDAIQFARYLPLAARGGRLVLACDRRLMPLLSAAPGVAHACDADDEPPPYDVWISQMSLPGLFGATPNNVPAADGFLEPRWAPAQNRKPRVGIVWAGNPLHSNDRRRSLPREKLAALAEAPVEWVSLQVGARSGEAADLGAADLSAGLPDFLATARVVEELDQVVSVDSAVAHLAGALGCPVWILLPHAPCWRWTGDGDRTPWYSAARLFRQREPGGWADVVRRVTEALRSGARETRIG
jgi:tetratricopeptide (TPR) repeat protein